MADGKLLVDSLGRVDCEDLETALRVTIDSAFVSATLDLAPAAPLLAGPRRPALTCALLPAMNKRRSASQAEDLRNTRNAPDCLPAGPRTGDAAILTRCVRPRPSPTTFHSNRQQPMSIPLPTPLAPPYLPPSPAPCIAASRLSSRLDMSSTSSPPQPVSPPSIGLAPRLRLRLRRPHTHTTHSLLASSSADTPANLPASWPSSSSTTAASSAGAAAGAGAGALSACAGEGCVSARWCGGGGGGGRERAREGKGGGAVPGLPLGGGRLRAGRTWFVAGVWVGAVRAWGAELSAAAACVPFVVVAVAGTDCRC